MTISLLITLLTLHIIALISPGPDFFVVIKNTLSNGQRSGIATAIGISLGILVHILYSIFGLGLLISKSILLFTAIKMLGALYLLWIAYQSRISTASAMQVKQLNIEQQLSTKASLRNGFLTNVLNPKATLYFLSVFTTMVNPDMQIQEYLLLATLMIVTTALWFILVTYFFTSPKIRSYYEHSQSKINKTFSVILLLLGIKILTSK